MQSQSPNEQVLFRLEEHLKQENYCGKTFQRWTEVARRFLRYLDRRHIAVETAELTHVGSYLTSELRLFRQRYHRSPSPVRLWRNSHTGGIHMLLRLAQPQWPPAVVPTTSLDAFNRQVCEEYGKWMRDVRGLAPESRYDRSAEAQRFLGWLGERGNQPGLLLISATDIDAYMTSRTKSLRRISLKGCGNRLRNFLRYLRDSGRVTRDLAAAVICPTLYAFESIPSSLKPEHIQAILEKTRQDHSRTGLRDYAILMLLSTYGLRAGEVTALRLDDVDWQKEVLRIRHSKTGAHSELPLLATVGNAILDYLQKGRPQTQARAIFIRSHAPYQPFQRGSSLYTPIQRRLTAAGIDLTGKRGPHIFRHARAVSLLRVAVPMKEIGDILGHRGAASTAIYLKLAIDDLRSVALEIPVEVKP
jgi:integrase/recombinase XerD